jgi:hypothetical protein
MSFTPKPSQAVKIWLGVVALVLGLLFMQTRGKGSGDFNFFLNTDSDAIGAEVYVDGILLGKIDAGPRSGLGGGTFWGHLTQGKHLVEVRKPKYKPFQTEVDMHGKDYRGVDLKPLRD